MQGGNFRVRLMVVGDLALTEPPKQKAQMKTLMGLVVGGVCALVGASCSSMENMMHRHHSGDGNRVTSTGSHEMGPPGRSQPMANAAMPRYAGKTGSQQR